jgi:hypothetical protein
MNSPYTLLLIISAAAAVSSYTDINLDGEINVVTTINRREGVVTVQIQADGVEPMAIGSKYQPRVLIGDQVAKILYFAFRDKTEELGLLTNNGNVFHDTKVTEKQLLLLLRLLALYSPDFRDGVSTTINKKTELYVSSILK